MAPIRSSMSVRSEHSSHQVPVAGDALSARKSLAVKIISELLASGILLEEANSSPSSSPARRRHVSSCRSRPEYIRRPSNSFFLFRSDCVLELGKQLKGRRYCSKKFSKEIGMRWKSLSEAQKELYKILALEAAETHQRLHPDYKYQPNLKKTQRKRGKGKKNAEVETPAVAQEATFVPHAGPFFVSELTSTIALPELVPDVFPNVLPPSHPVPAERRFQSDFVDGTLRPSTFKDDPLRNFRRAADANVMLFSSSGSLAVHSPSSYGLDQGLWDLGDSSIEFPSPGTLKFDWNEWSNIFAEGEVQAPVMCDGPLYSF